MGGVAPHNMSMGAEGRGWYIIPTSQVLKRGGVAPYISLEVKGGGAQVH